ncbi:hypothetical protein ACJX0J_022696, partial [Zea mays]
GHEVLLFVWRMDFLNEILFTNVSAISIKNKRKDRTSLIAATPAVQRPTYTSNYTMHHILEMVNIISFPYFMMAIYQWCLASFCFLNNDMSLILFLFSLILIMSYNNLMLICDRGFMNILIARYIDLKNRKNLIYVIF